MINDGRKNRYSCDKIFDGREPYALSVLIAGIIDFLALCNKIHELLP